MTAIEVLHVVHDRELRAPAMNMALDEALLATATTPTVRFYRWRAPAVSFGYFSRLAEARQLAGDRELVRRWTGGGIVMHGDDLTYAFVVPAAHVVAQQPAREIYVLVHGAITTALALNGVNAKLADKVAPRISDACFANPVRADVLIDGRKIVGAAQRRTRAGLLQQGSIQLRGLSLRFAADVAAALSHNPRETSFAAAALATADELVAQKYGTPEWLTRC